MLQTANRRYPASPRDARRASCVVSYGSTRLYCTPRIEVFTCAYGSTVVATGSRVNDFSFWFSSKYLDEETGLYYYGRRHYSPGQAQGIGAAFSHYAIASSLTEDSPPISERKDGLDKKDNVSHDVTHEDCNYQTGAPRLQHRAGMGGRWGGGHGAEPDPSRRPNLPSARADPGQVQDAGLCGTRKGDLREQDHSERGFA